MSDAGAEGLPEDRYAGRPPFRRRAVRAPLLHRVLPVTGDVARYETATARSDLAAGLTVAALAIPAAMAYAELAGVSPVHGLYALLLPTVAYVLLGSSRQLVVGPEGSLSALVAAAVLPGAVAGSPEAAAGAAVLALLVGGCFLLARAARLWWVADYLSRPVLVGYVHGVAVVLVVSQLPKLLGVSVDATGTVPELVAVARELPHADPATIAVAVAALAVLVPGRVLTPRLPAALFVVVLAIVASSALALGDHGVAVVGEIGAGLPRAALPGLSLNAAVALLPAAAGVFAVCFADEVLTARAFAGRHGQHVDVGREQVAMGVANAAAGLFQGVPVGASGSRTAVNDAMGARSQVSGLVAVAAVVGVLLLLTGPIAELPRAVLGAVIVTAAVGLVAPQEWRALARADRVELAIAAVTAAGVVLAGVLDAIVFAVGLSIVDVVRRSARPHDAVLGWVPGQRRWADVSRHPRAKVVPGVVVYRLDDRLFFANAGYVRGRVAEALAGAPSPPRCLVFDAEGLTAVDSSGLEALEALVAAQRGDGVDVRIARVKGPVLADLRDGGLTGRLGEDHVHPTVRAAVAAA